MFQMKVHVISLKDCVLLIKKFCSRPLVCFSLQAIQHNLEKAESHGSATEHASMGLRVCVNKWQPVSLRVEVVVVAYWLSCHWSGKTND